MRWVETMQSYEILDTVRKSGIRTYFCCFPAENIQPDEWNILKGYVDASTKQGVSLVVIDTPSAKQTIMKYTTIKNIPLYVITVDPAFQPSDNQIPIYINLSDQPGTDSSCLIILAKLEQYATNKCTSLLCISKFNHGWIKASFELGVMNGKIATYHYCNSDGNWVTEKGKANATA